MKKTELCVLFGGRSSEHEVSLSSASNVLSAIDREKYNVRTIGITKNGIWYLYKGDEKKIKDGSWENEDNDTVCISLGGDGMFTSKGEKIPCDVVLPVLHGEYCEDGRLQGLLDTCGIKYVGCTLTASDASMNKYLTKLVAENWNVPVTKYIHVRERRFTHHKDELFNDVKAIFSYPVFVKPVSAGSSVGASKVNCEDELEAALANAIKYGGEALIEEYKKAKEIEVAVFGNDDPIASVCGEINPGAEFYDYDTKYKNDTASFYIPARISKKTSKQVREYALRIFRALGCRGLSRVDFFVDDEENILFNEINTFPGFTNISMYPTLLGYGDDGMKKQDIVDGLIKLALE